MKTVLPGLLALIAVPAMAEDTRQLDSHVHGSGELDIAVDGNTVAMELRAPGADIVGFEYEAKSEEARAAIDAGIVTLATPADLFIFPAAAACTVTQASAQLETEDDHEDHDHDDHAHEDKEHDHDDHAHEDKEHDHDDHAHDEHAEDKDDHAHDEHAHDDHAHDEDEHAHEAHSDEERHTEFHASYILNCAEPDAISDITFAYFDRFEGALDLTVQIVTENGAQAFDVEREAPVLNLKGVF